MFYIRNDRIVLVDSDADVCSVDEVDSAIQALQQFKSTNVEIDEDRYTNEGIDKEFRASPDFIPSKEIWKEDSKTDWRGIAGPDLFNRYQRHAETYCWGCNDYGQEPTYEGFRQWLIQLRDMAGEDDQEI